MSRIGPAIAAAREQGRTALAPFLTVGYPEPDAFPGLVKALVEGGADMLELGVPFSDPLADGATIQRANFAALQHGVTTSACLEAVRGLRSQGLEVPVLLMGYYNPILAYGLADFAADAAAAGVDGFIVVDLPPEESGPFQEACRERGLDLVYLLAPTSTPERVALVARQASGFVYCVSVTGVTGARSTLPPELPVFVEGVRRQTTLPLAVGFGISRHEHVQAVGRIAEVAVVGSALIDVIDSSPAREREARVRAYVEVLAGRREATGGRRRG